MRVNAVSPDTMEILLRLLTPQNAAVCRLCLAYGLRVGDVLALHSSQAHSASVTIREQKTGKRRKIIWTERTRALALSCANSVWCFPGRVQPLVRHRTRQAVYKDINRAAKALRLRGSVGTHSMRKSYAVRKYAACGDMRKVKQLLNHTDEAVTILYALASEISDAQAKGAKTEC